jgi:hypothetical protein
MNDENHQDEGEVEEIENHERKEGGKANNRSYIQCQSHEINSMKSSLPKKQ